jgi:hypothetical protein
MRHALGDVGGRHGRAATGRPAGQVTMSAAEILPPAPAPDRAREAAPARKGGGVHWFRLVVIALILTGAAATLARSIWSRHGAPPSP